LRLIYYFIVWNVYSEEHGKEMQVGVKPRFFPVAAFAEVLGRTWDLLLEFPACLVASGSIPCTLKEPMSSKLLFIAAHVRQTNMACRNFLRMYG
jgi:hypothetical protein